MAQHLACGHSSGVDAQRICGVVDLLIQKHPGACLQPDDHGAAEHGAPDAAEQRRAVDLGIGVRVPAIPAAIAAGMIVPGGG